VRPSAPLVFAALLPSTALAQTAPTVDLEVGYRFDYADCVPARKKKDPPVCSRTEYLYVLKGGETLREEYDLKYVVPGRNSGTTSTVPVRSLSWSDHEIVQASEGYTDDKLVAHPIWTLKLETNGHEQAVRVEYRSDLLGESTSHAYLFSLAFPSEEAAEQAWTQIRAAKERLK
jgi:hypothetical protein